MFKAMLFRVLARAGAALDRRSPPIPLMWDDELAVLSEDGVNFNIEAYADGFACKLLVNSKDMQELAAAHGVDPETELACLLVTHIVLEAQNRAGIEWDLEDASPDNHGGV